MTDEEFNNRGISEYRSIDFIEMGFLFFAFSFNKSFIFKHIKKLILEGLSEKAETVLYDTFLDHYSLYDNLYPSRILTKKQHTKLIETLIKKGKKEYELQKTSSSAHSALSGLVTKNNKLYINQLLFENKLEKFLLPKKLMEEYKEQLLYLYQKIIFVENGDFTLILPTVGSFKYPDNFLKYIKNEDIYNEKNTFFFWTSKLIDWQYGTYLNILKILQDVLGEKYLQVVPIASHGNEYNISDIFVFDASVATKEYPVLQIKQNELMKWEIINTYDSFENMCINMI